MEIQFSSGIVDDNSLIFEIHNPVFLLDEDVHDMGEVGFCTGDDEVGNSCAMITSEYEIV